MASDTRTIAGEGADKPSVPPWMEDLAGSKDPVIGRYRDLGIDVHGNGEPDKIARDWFERSDYQKTKLVKTARPREAIYWDPQTMVVPVVTGNNKGIISDAVEDSVWTRGAGNTVVGLGSVQLTEVQRICSALYMRHPLAKNIIHHYTYLTVGEGVKVVWMSYKKNGRQVSIDKRNETWRQIARRLQFQRYVRQMVMNTFLLGEWFTATLPKRKTGRAVKTGFRGIEPDRIPRIFYDSEDQSQVAGYQYTQINGQSAIVQPEDMVHARIGMIGNVPRGIPILLPVLSLLRYWSLFVENRHWINAIRARLPIIRRVKGSSTQVSTEASRITTQGVPKPATIITDPEGYEWLFPSHNIGASDAEADGALLLNGIAAGVSLPARMVLMDASQETYSAGQLSEGTMVRMFLDYQDQFRFAVEELIQELTGEEPDVSFKVIFPRVVRRGVGELAAALRVATEGGYMSRETAAEMLGLSWEEEQDRILAERDLGLDLGSIFGFSGANAMAPDAKKVDGGPGEPPEGSSLGAAASPRERPATSPDTTPAKGKPTQPASDDVLPTDPGQEAPTLPEVTLNGAQIDSLRSIVTDVVTKQLPMETAVQLMLAAFPFDESRARAILSGAETFTPAPEKTRDAPPTA